MHEYFSFVPWANIDNGVSFGDIFCLNLSDAIAKEDL